ncbi:hypothetical protein X798_08169 [Onchocerca flexuosa]|uniref:Uncharacterized protein n=1 Tax=Onchocerca flexuosa TaxID=387005 RepID=A0A238BHA8_9BILA|nr:hypothetical protein X798_08169 [Onchocerca flexuosa]
MVENKETKRSKDSFKLGNIRNYATNSSSSLRTAISMVDEEKESRKSLEGKNFNNAYGELYSLIG